MGCCGSREDGSSPSAGGGSSRPVRVEDEWTEADALLVARFKGNTVDGIPSLHLPVQKMNPRGTWQPRILHVDLENKVIHNCHKGKAHTSFPFDNIREIEESQTQSKAFSIYFKEKIRDHEFYTLTEQEREVVVGDVLYNTFNQRGWDAAKCTHDQLVRLPVWPAPYTHSGKVEKEGDVKWSARWACIVNARLYVFRDHSQVEHSRPLNVIPIIDAVVDKKGTRQFSVEIEARHFNFRCENEETTDAWIKELLRIKRDPYPPPADRRRKKK